MVKHTTDGSGEFTVNGWLRRVKDSTVLKDSTDVQWNLFGPLTAFL